MRVTGFLNGFWGLVQDRTMELTPETLSGILTDGGTPSAADRVLATWLGTHGARLLGKRQYGFMLAVRHGALVPPPLEDVAEKRNKSC